MLTVAGYKAKTLLPFGSSKFHFLTFFFFLFFGFSWKKKTSFFFFFGHEKEKKKDFLLCPIIWVQEFLDVPVGLKNIQMLEYKNSKKNVNKRLLSVDINYPNNYFKMSLKF